MVNSRFLSTLSLLAILCAALLIGGCGEDSGSDEPEEAFEPQASLTAIGGTTRTEKPELVMRVEARHGDENIRSAAVLLPSAVLVDQAALGNICSERELVEKDCKGRKRMGAARVLSPAYDGPLEGPVYAVSGSGGLPRLAYVLSGPADVLLRGRIVVKNARIQAGLEDVPDTPLKTFEFSIDGGKPGYLVLSQDICSRPVTADASFTSQGGQDFEQRIPLEADCKS